MKQLDKDIETRQFKRAYLIFGEEGYLVKDYTKRLCSAVVPEESSVMNMEVFEGKDCNVSKMIQSGDTAPFFNDYRLVLVRGSGLFREGRKADTSAMSEALKNIPEDCVYVFSDENVDKRNSLYKAVKKLGYCCEIGSRDMKELSQWLIQRTDGRLSSSAASYMVKNIGSDMTHLAVETDKLLAYAGDKKITTADIDTACTRSPEVNIFNMVAAIGNKNAERALEIYNNMIFDGEEPIGILAMIARQFRLMLQCGYLKSKKNYGSKQIAEELKLREFVVSNCLGQGRNFKLNTLIRALKDCARCDSDIKSGLVAPELGVELIILKYSKKI